MGADEKSVDAVWAKLQAASKPPSSARFDAVWSVVASGKGPAAPASAKPAGKAGGAQAFSPVASAVASAVQAAAPAERMLDLDQLPREVNALRDDAPGTRRRALERLLAFVQAILPRAVSRLAAQSSGKYVIKKYD